MDGELNGQHENNSPQNGEKIVSTKITRPRVGQYEITRLRDGWHKNNSPKGWTGGQLNGQHENNSPKNWTVQNNSPKGWMGGKLNGQHENNSPKDGESNS